MLPLNHLNNHSRYTRILEKYVFSMLTIFFFVVVIFSLLVVYVAKLPLENPFKPADIYFANFVCVAFWLKWF